MSYSRRFRISTSPRFEPLEANLSQSKDGASDGDIPNRSTAGDAMTTVGKLPGILSRTNNQKVCRYHKTISPKKISESEVSIATSSNSALTADGWMCAHQRREFGINKAGSKSGRGCGRRETNSNPSRKTTSKQNNNECRGGKERATRSKKGMLSEKNGRGEGGRWRWRW
ncbi:hypothetical protein ASPTUDRAFT_343912 [Aspergillus tubingensis CBS 134.48]|uniref:Uncharacterized protein n=1 Tax=Aspergillus tubingensis (strain CBS 134.48) TaxID=767770 RepID=A0A1L9NKL8_ASPTC|nr:hypothetical protein ASPTUDRAFT_343912 [Aspergillus tubingensis CBS 134.48]